MARYLGFSLGIRKGTIIMDTNFDITARLIETTDFAFFLIEKRYKASITKNICNESQCPLAAKLIRTKGLHAYINTLAGSFLITFKYFTKTKIERMSKRRKADFIDTNEWEIKSAIANTINVRGG